MTIRMLCAGSALFLAVSGCVGQGAYQKKVDEVAYLGRSLDDLKRSNAELSNSNDGLRGEISGLQKKVEELEVAKKELERTLSTKDDGPYQRVAELEREKARLTEDLARIHLEQDEKVRDVSRGYESLLEKLKDEIARGTVQISELRGRLSIGVRDDVLFDNGSSELKASGAVLLGRLGDFFKAYTGNNFVVGVSFSVPQSRPGSAGHETSPWNLPTARSVAVARYLVQYGVAAHLIEVIVQGEFERSGTVIRGKTNKIEVSVEVKE